MGKQTFKSLLSLLVLAITPTLSFCQWGMSQDVSAADEELARSTMEYWKAEVDKEPELLSDSSALTLYREAWGALDLQEAIKIDEEEAWHGHRLNLAARLAFLGMNQPQESKTKKLISKQPSLDLEPKDLQVLTYNRFGDLEKVIGRLKWPSYYATRFWVRFAEIGLERNDEKMVELAIQKFQVIAESTELESKSPPIENLEIRAGRFFMAAAKLELERGKEKPDDEVINKTIQQLQIAGRSFAPGNVWMSFYNLDEMQQFANLESYRLEGQYFAHDPAAKKLGNQILEPLRELASPGYCWIYKIPNLESEIVNPWLVRQALRGRAEVAVSYLLWAEGDPIVRSRLLAVLAEQLADTKPEMAKALNKVAIRLFNDDVVRPEPSKNIGYIRDPYRRATTESANIEALAQIALAHRALSEEAEFEHKTKQCLARFSQLLTDDESEFKDKIPFRELWEKYSGKIDHECLNTVARATALAGLKVESLPNSFVRILSQTGNSSRLRQASNFTMRRVDYRFDVSSMVELEDEYRYPEHMDYYKFKENAQYQQAALEVLRLAEGNLAWYSSLPEIVIDSVRDMGLKKTLEWVKVVENKGDRLQLEAAAVRAIMETKSRKIIRGRRPYAPSRSVAPGIRWPTNGC